MKVDAVILNNLLNKLIAINNTYYANPSDKDGDIGERFVKDSIKYYMYKKGFKLCSSGDRTYTIWKPPKKGQSGADFPFSFTHNSTVCNCYIESKNWGVYKFIPPSRFNKEILNRFILKANQHGCYWIVTMNQANIPLIIQRCQQYRIIPVPIDTKITTTQLTVGTLTPIMEHFLDDFHRLMRSLTYVKLRRPRKQIRPNSKPYDDDIIMGLPSDLIAQMHGTTKKNIEKRRAELKQQAINVLDMRSKTAWLARLMTKHDLDTGYIMGIIIEMLKEKYKGDVYNK